MDHVINNGRVAILLAKSTHNEFTTSQRFLFGDVSELKFSVNYRIFLRLLQEDSSDDMTIHSTKQ